jgi:protein subunit release factor B
MLCRIFANFHPIAIKNLNKNVVYFSKNTRRPPQAVLLEKDIEESFCRGAGPGGQKINKSMNKVRLKHIPTGLTVAVQEQRDLTTNRQVSSIPQFKSSKIIHLMKFRCDIDRYDV